MTSRSVFRTIVHGRVSGRGEITPCRGEQGRGELRINFGQLRRYDVAQQSQGLATRTWRDLDKFRAVVVEAGLLCDFRNAVSRMNAFQPEPPPLAIEAEQTAAGHERDRAARTVNIGRAPARRADE